MFALVLMPCAFAQKAPDSKTPDQRFADLVVSATPMGLAKTSNGLSTTRDELATAVALQAERERQTAQAAKAFYTQNPGHPKATEAQKIEALGSVRGTPAGDTVEAFAAIKLAKAFRERTDVPVKDRFEVALAADRLALTVKIKAKTAADQPLEWQLVAERLRTAERGQALGFGVARFLFIQAAHVAPARRRGKAKRGQALGFRVPLF